MTLRLTSTLTLAALATLSVGSFTVVEVPTASMVIGFAAFAIALVKIVLILNRYMHLEWHHRPFAQVLSAWLLVVGIILGAGLAVLPPIHPLPASRDAAGAHNELGKE